MGRVLWASVIAGALAFAAPAFATTESFTTPGQSTWTSPADISSARFELNGGAGGSWSSAPGGKGGSTLATLPVAPVTGYGLYVASPGGPGGGTGTFPSTAPGGVPGGAFGQYACFESAGGITSCESGAGGGGVTIVSAGAADLAAASNWLLAAGGGGGARITAGGAGGGLDGASGVGSAMQSCTTVGQGGNQTGSTGSGQHTNGSSGPPGVPSGGGGGGFYGGAYGVCGGGGGSGYIAPSARAGSFGTPTATGNGSISITHFGLSAGTIGEGIITGAGITCGAGETDCLERFGPGDPITLTATPATGWKFEAFLGAIDCAESTCTGSIDEDDSVRAVFSKLPDVAVEPPETTITAKPPAKTKRKRVTFEFVSNAPGATFECALDDEAFGACQSPKTVRAKKGRHFFSVRAVNATGLADPSPAVASWKVKKKPSKPPRD